MSDIQAPAQANLPGFFAQAILPDDATLLSSDREFLVKLGLRVRDMRKLRAMSRRDLSRKTGISERYLAQIETGRGNVSIVLLRRIACAIQDGEREAH